MATNPVAVPSGTIVKLSNIKKTFWRGSEAVKVLDGLSLDVPAGPEQPTMEVAPPESDDPFTAVDDNAWLQEALSGLTDRERLVLRLRFVDVLTQSDIADQIGVSQMQVSRILRSILTRLRSRLQASMNDAA